MLKKFFVDYLPATGIVKRYCSALWASFYEKSSYSQFGEDKYIIQILSDFGIYKGNYVDVGANHPSSISNTYLLYRKGFSGIVIEPNAELIELFRIFRRRDTAICVGCSNEASIAHFYISKTPVLSTFTKQHRIFSMENTMKIEFVPLLTLDNCLKNFAFDRIDFLSIDVEGLNMEVVKGAYDTLKKTFLLCLEFDKEDELDLYTNYLTGFNRIKIMGCNAIYINEQISKTIVK
jgi:FkbM family methyltransferase